MIFNSASRAQVREAERQWVAKFVLRWICLFASLISIAITGASAQYALGIVWLTIPTGLSVIWNAANIIVRLSRARPMHPGANVGCDLILWLGLLAGLVFSYAAGVLLLSVADDSYYSSSSRSYCYFRGSRISGGDACSDVLGRVGALDIAASVFGTVSLILHFILFVWACVDTHRRNNDVEQRAAQIAANIIAQQQTAGHMSMAPQPQGYYAAPPSGPPPPGVGTAYGQHQHQHPYDMDGGAQKMPYHETSEYRGTPPPQTNGMGHDVSPIQPHETKP